MKLIDVKSAKLTEIPGHLVLRIVADADDGHGPYEVDFGFHPSDPFGLGPACRQWLADHPELPIGPAE